MSGSSTDRPFLDHLQVHLYSFLLSSTAFSLFSSEKKVLNKIKARTKTPCTCRIPVLYLRHTDSKFKTLFSKASLYSIDMIYKHNCWKWVKHCCLDQSSNKSGSINQSFAYKKYTKNNFLTISSTLVLASSIISWQRFIPSSLANVL